MVLGINQFMQLYRCKTLNKDGDVVGRKIFADEHADLFEVFKKSELVFISKTEHKSSIRNPITDFTLPFFRSLTQLVKNRLNLIDALKIIASLLKNEEKRLIVETIMSQIKSGKTFSSALSDFNRYFDKLTIKTIEISEKTAELSEAMDRIVEHLEASVKLKNKIKESIRYPIILLGVIFLVFLFWIFVLVPKFAELFVEINIQPPLISRIIIKFSHFVINHSWIILSCIIAGSFFVLRYFHSRSWISSKIPILSKMQRESKVYNFFTGMEIMLHEKVNLIEALECMSDTIPQLNITIESIKSGNTLTTGLKKSKFLNDYELSIIKTGEQSGDLWPAFKSVSDIAKQNIEHISQRIVAVIQPIAISLMGSLLIFIVIALINPLYSNLDLGTM